VAKLTWDQTGQRRYENGIDHGVLYLPNALGVYDSGFSWNGLTTVTESPTGAEPNKQYADNRVYINLRSAEEFGATIEAFTYPEEFARCDGTAEPIAGVTVGQQNRMPFGLSYRTKIGTDTDPDAGYKLHLVYGCTAAPSEKAFTTVNDSPEAATFSWEITTDPVAVPGNDPGTGNPYKPTALLTIDSTTVDETALAALEDLLYGTVGTDPSLPSPGAVIAMFTGTLTLATPTEPAWNGTTNTITIPTVTGVEYLIDGVVVAAGDVVITVPTVVTARPAAGYYFPSVVDDDWYYDPAT
jgi:hypothetical protein